MEAVRELAHTADVGFEIEASSAERLFELAAGGLFEALGASPSDLPGQEDTLELVRPDVERLLVAWLRELLDIALTREAVSTRTSVTLIGDTALRAVIRWRPWTSDGPTREIKGVTYHGLRVVADADGRWHGRVVLDV
jgi:SHS2 domain-containing protein